MFILLQENFTMMRFLYLNKTGTELEKDVFLELIKDFYNEELDIMVEDVTYATAASSLQQELLKALPLRNQFLGWSFNGIKEKSGCYLQ